MKDSIPFSVENIIKYGDTDIFPYPLERQVFRDKKDKIIDLLNQIKGNFNAVINLMPTEHEKLLHVVGYTGFRQGTQIDPVWNAYLLALVISIGDDIEKTRIPLANEIVFSYRFKPDRSKYTIFDKNYGWLAFQQKSVEHAQNHKFVLICDISDFYPRIYHNRLENYLKKATGKTYAIKEIKYLLNSLSKGVPYGLPIGGPAARLLSELLLNRIDRLLFSQNITFCRFVDDYHFFGKTKEELYGNLIYLNETLLNNEGLSLQKTKTRILSSTEFLESSSFFEENIPDEQEELERRNFLKFHVHYDPYSDTSDEDYETLCEELNKFDVVGMLAREMQKSRIAEGVTKKLIKAIAHTQEPVKNTAVTSLLQNLHVLYPVFPTVMLLLKGIINDLNNEVKGKVFSTLREVIETNSYLCKVTVNLSFAIRVLAYDFSDETDSVLIKIFLETPSVLIKRDIILVLAMHNADYWISDELKRYNVATTWEKRSLLVASYILKDEGKEWRKRIENGLSDFDKIVREWASEQKYIRKKIEI
jgi:hypothetical protein